MHSNIGEFKRIFITGGTGYIGKAVLKEFLANNYKVMALVRDEERGKEVEKLGAEFLVGDLGDSEKLEKAAADMDGIVHCARDHSPTANEKDLIAINTFKKICEENSKTKPCTFIYTSGCLSIGEGEDVKDEFFTIENPHPYGKWRLEHEPKVLESSKDLSNFTTAVIRPSWVYGRGAGLITDYLRKCKTDKIVYLVGEGNAHCNFIHVGDLARLYYVILNNHLSGLFHATDNNYFPIRDIANGLKTYLNADIKTVTLEEGMQLFGFSAYSQIIDQKMITKRSLEIGWTPEYQSFLSNLDELFNDII